MRPHEFFHGAKPFSRILVRLCSLFYSFNMVIRPVFTLRQMDCQQSNWVLFLVRARNCGQWQWRHEGLMIDDDGYFHDVVRPTYYLIGPPAEWVIAAHNFNVHTITLKGPPIPHDDMLTLNNNNQIGPSMQTLLPRLSTQELEWLQTQPDLPTQTSTDREVYDPHTPWPGSISRDLPLSSWKYTSVPLAGVCLVREIERRWVEALCGNVQ